MSTARYPAFGRRYHPGLDSRAEEIARHSIEQGVGRAVGHRLADQVQELPEEVLKELLWPSVLILRLQPAYPLCPACLEAVQVEESVVHGLHERVCSRYPEELSDAILELGPSSFQVGLYLALVCIWGLVSVPFLRWRRS